MVKEVSKRVSLVPNASLPPNVFTSEYKTTQIGDDAEIEGYVLPRNSAEFSEERLLSRVAENGKRLCRGDFRIVETHYFYGKEATLKFLRIETPALRVRYRCTVTLAIPADNRTGISLERVSREVQDFAFFDISTKRFPVSRNALFEIVRRVAIQEGIPITKEGKAGEDLFLIGGRDSNELRWGRIEKLAALFSDDPAGSMLTFRLFAYQLTYHKRGVLETERPAVARGAQPWDRRVAYSRAMLFLGAVDAAMAKGQ